MEQPSGRVGLLFSDVEGSTRLLQRLGADRYAEVLDRHCALLRDAFAACDGYEVATEGDSFFVAFASAEQAVAAALRAQRALADERWPEGAMPRVRMGVHVGEPLLRPPNYVGLDVHRAARVMAAAHGGQVLVSGAARDLVQDRFALRDLGEHRLKDLLEPVRLFQLCGDGLGQDFPPPRSLGGRPSNLPHEPNRLIGREHELETLRRLLREDDVRVVTLTGIGGVGKSRLATHAAAAAAADFADGACFVNLASVFETANVMPAVAQALDVRERPPAPALETLVEHVRDRKLLLVLDNFEQVTGAAPDLAALVAAAPRLRVIVTSQVPLHLALERVLQVPPLAVPRGAMSFDELEACEAVRLFVERAQSASTAFGLDDANSTAVAEICARLDGLPLAIELAAARIPLLSPHEILDRLHDRFELLRGRRSDVAPRQRTLRSTIDWSYALLERVEQQLLAELSVFAGGASVTAVEQVCGDGTALEALAQLVESSLVNRSETDEGDSRYSLFESIQEYARERLEESGSVDEVRGRHAAFVADLVEAADRPGAEPTHTWLVPLERETDNIREAVEWTLRHDVELGARIVGALWFAWTSLGHVSDGRRWAKELLAAYAPEDSLVRARLLQASAHFAEGVNSAELRVLAEECLRVSRRIGYRRGIAMSLSYLAAEAAVLPDAERARSLGEEAVRMAEDAGDSEIIEHSLNALGVSAVARGDFQEMIRLEERVLALAQSRDDPVAVARALGNLAYSYTCLGGYEVADPLAEESLSIEREIQNRPGVAWAAANAGLSAIFRGDAARAEERFHESLELARAYGHKRRLAESLLGLGAVASLRGELGRAAQLAGGARTLFDEVGGQMGVAEERLYDQYLATALEHAAAAEGDSLVPELEQLSETGR
jgi:predicted ATPase/class 3 adenylate cyclase